MRKISYIVVHCSGGSQKQSIQSIQAWWKSIGWKSPGYHYIVRADGVYQQLQPDHLLANGVAGYNRQCIHVCYIGGIDNNGKPIDNRTEAQKKMLRSLLKELKVKYPTAKIRGHRDFSPDLNGNGTLEPWEYIKSCPCFNAITEYQDL